MFLLQISSYKAIENKEKEPAISHHSGRKPHVFTGSVNQHTGILIHQFIGDGRIAQPNGVGVVPL